MGGLARPCEHCGGVVGGGGQTRQGRKYQEHLYFPLCRHVLINVLSQSSWPFMFFFLAFSGRSIFTCLCLERNRNVEQWHFLLHYTRSCWCSFWKKDSLCCFMEINASTMKESRECWRGGNPVNLFLYIRLLQQGFGLRTGGFLSESLY